MSTIHDLYSLREKYGGSLIKKGLTFFDNFLVYKFNKKPSRCPMYLSWNITYRCNARCIYCSAYKKITKEKELTTNKVINIIKQAAKLGVCNITFTGGEPLLREDIITLINEAKKHNIHVSINTNGALLKKKAKELVDSGVDTIIISIDSYDPKTHDGIRQYLGLFKLAEEGIEKVKSLRKSRKPLISIRGVVSVKNYKQLNKFVLFWKDKVDSISLQPLHDNIPSSVNYYTSKNLNMQEKNRKDYVKEFNKIKRIYPSFNSYYYNEFENFFFNRDYLKNKFKCCSGFFNIKIDPYGNVYPCASLTKKIGNLMEKTLIKIIRSKELNDFKKLKKECICWSQDSLINVYLKRFNL